MLELISYLFSPLQERLFLFQCLLLLTLARRLCSSVCRRNHKWPYICQFSSNPNLDTFNLRTPVDQAEQITILPVRIWPLANKFYSAICHLASSATLMRSFPLPSASSGRKIQIIDKATLLRLLVAYCNHLNWVITHAPSFSSPSKSSVAVVVPSKRIHCAYTLPQFSSSKTQILHQKGREREIHLQLGGQMPLRRVSAKKANIRPSVCRYFQSREWTQQCGEKYPVEWPLC